MTEKWNGEGEGEQEIENQNSYLRFGLPLQRRLASVAIDGQTQHTRGLGNEIPKMIEKPN